MLPLHTTCSALDYGHLQAPSDLFVSRSLPLDLHVVDDTRAKIVANKYIDLDVLVPKPSVSPLIPEAGSFQLVDGALKIVPSSKAKKIKTIDNWCSAFNIFIAIYCRAHPACIQELMRYVESKMGICSSGIFKKFPCEKSPWQESLLLENR
jgi:hypothetical protein